MGKCVCDPDDTTRCAAEVGTASPSPSGAIIFVYSVWIPLRYSLKHLSGQMVRELGKTDGPLPCVAN